MIVDKYLFKISDRIEKILEKDTEQELFYTFLTGEKRLYIIEYNLVYIVYNGKCKMGGNNEEN